MKALQLGAVLAFGVAVSGCATIIQGTTQTVSVNTLPEQGASCTLKNSEGTWYVTTPGSTTVHKTKNDMTIDCTKAGAPDGHYVASSHFGGTTAGNVIAGGIIGIGIDAASGANYYYDSPINVTMGATTTGAPTPATPAATSSSATTTPPASPATPAAPAKTSH
jgi:hypothetical protein